MFLPDALRQQADYCANPSLKTTPSGMARKASTRVALLNFLLPALRATPPAAS